jgi:N-methylhydantoinase A
MWRIGADIGGTFTDVVALSPDGRLERMKELTTPGRYPEAILAALRRRLGEGELREVSTFVHGTTVATNAILEGLDADMALVTTEGFRDVLELRRSRRPTLYDLSWRPPPALVPRALRFELSERVGADGTVLIAPSDEALDACVGAVTASGVQSVGVCLVNSFANPDHETLVADRLRAALPGVAVTCSALTVPELGEYERTSTTVINAFLLPVMGEYLADLERALTDAGITAPLHLMQSDGRTLPATLAGELPYLIIESGPAAGVVAAAKLAEELDRRAVITFDMGGTTAKASVVEDFQVTLTQSLEVGDALSRGSSLLRGSGYSVLSPCVDLTEVGAGGGSIAWIDGGGALRVGPRSAGSEPGPACYGGGGTEPTVTDAHVVLGHLNPTAIAGGSKPIHADLAHAAIGGLAEQLGMSPVEAALGIHAVATAVMRRAVRAVTVERGRDPRAFTLFAFGGAGGLHAAALATELGIGEIVVPMASGLLSSLGLLLSDVGFTRVAACRIGVPDGMDELRTKVDELAAEAAEELTRRHAGAEPHFEATVHLRYVGQSSTIALPLALEGLASEGSAAALVAAFHAEHERAYGHAGEGEAVEAMSLRVTAATPAPETRFSELAAQFTTTATPTAGSREAYFGGTFGWQTAAVLDRSALTTEPLAGPLVIEEPEATIVVPPGFSASRDATGSVVLRAAT